MYYGFYQNLRSGDVFDQVKSSNKKKHDLFWAFESKKDWYING